jgi:tRNA A-37 threonylcarbamoyl transferase component Bud32
MSDAVQDEVIALFQELADLSPSEREACYARRRITAAIRDEVESLLRFDQGSESLNIDVAATAEEVLQAQAWPAPASENTAWGPYRVIRLLGRGGMGAVYLAERADGEVEQRVAIKVVRFTAELPVFQERFLAERRILASLNHPGIARLLDAGHTSEGQPYLVMEYIEGMPMDAYCASRDVPAVLRVFLLVCDAVSYAHRNLIVHRDLKPSNILIDAGGQPKLLDFGIAKILDDTERGQTTVRVLTPDYASPEQLRGEAHSTATDIYSLGAVLRRLLKGEIPRDVDAIIRKALRGEPEERYATVDALAEDVRAFLENRPVRARAGNIWYRARKFVRRYWVPVAASAVALLSLGAGLYVANRERAIAEQRFVHVRRLANRLFDIDGAIRGTPGTTRARQLIVSTSLEYLQKVGAEARGDRDLALEIGSAYDQLAHVQGVPVNPNLGQVKPADESLRKADGLVASVLKSAPGDRRALLLSATIAHDRMVLAGSQGRREESLKRAADAAGRLDRFAALGHLDDNEVKEVAFMYGNVAVTFDDDDRLADTIRYARRSIETAKQMRDTGGQQSLAWGILADALRQSGDLDGALTAIRESRRLQEQLPDTGQTWQRANLALALWREGSILGEVGDISLDRPRDAVAPLRRGLAIADELASKDRDDTSHHQLAGEIARRLGDVLVHSDAAAALAVYDHGIGQLHQVSSMNTAMRRTEAALLARSAFALRLLHRDADAGRRLDTAIHLLRETGDYPAARIELDSEADLVLRAMADHYAATRRAPKAEETYQELLAKLNAAHPDPENDLRQALQMSNSWADLARILRASGETQQAAQWAHKRERLWQGWNRKLPGNAFVQRQLPPVG